VPDDPRRASSVYIWSFLTAILAVIGFIVWCIYLLRFNVFKRFGVVTAGDRIKTFLLYFIAIGAMVGVIYIPPAIETIKAKTAYSDDEIVKDVNTMNMAICRLNYDSIPRKWDFDTLLVREELTSEVRYDDQGHVVIPGHETDFHIIDSADFRLRKMNTDSLVRLNDSLYISFSCPDYNFTGSARNGQFAVTRELGSVDIYNRLFKKQEVFDKAATRDRLFSLLHKYNNFNSNAEIYDEDDEDKMKDDYQSRIMKKYQLYAVNTAIDNIGNRKYRWLAGDNGLLVRTFWYSTLIFTLLIFIFRHSTARSFFLSILSAIILAIVTGVFMAFLHTDATGVLICSIIYYMIFAVLAIAVNYSKTRRLATGIAINLLVFFTVFAPLVITALYYQWLEDQLRDKVPPRLVNYQQEQLHYLYAEIIGAVLLLILIETGFKRLYRKWYALPEA
jgi:hypothetical protein